MPSSSQSSTRWHSFIVTKVSTKEGTMKDLWTSARSSDNSCDNSVDYLKPSMEFLSSSWHNFKPTHTTTNEMKELVKSEMF